MIVFPIFMFGSPIGFKIIVVVHFSQLPRYLDSIIFLRPLTNYVKIYFSQDWKLKIVCPQQKTSI